MKKVKQIFVERNVFHWNKDYIRFEQKKSVFL